MSTISILIQNSTEIPSLNNKARERNKRERKRKGRNQINPI
jgi:hypothetical protein